MAVTRDRPAPYAPASAVLELIKRHRDRGLPSPVNSEVLGRAGIALSLVPRTLQALEALDLIDESGAQTPVFEGIRVAPEAEYKKRLEDWLRAAYADAFAFVDPSKDDEVRIRDAFRSYQPIGQQSRMVTLFQGLCAEAGLMPEKSSAPRPSARVRPPTPSTPRVAAKAAVKSASSRTSAALPPALAGLLESLPNGKGWTGAERQKFLTTFTAVLDFCFSITEDDAEEAA